MKLIYFTKDRHSTDWYWFYLKSNQISFNSVNMFFKYYAHNSLKNMSCLITTEKQNFVYIYTVYFPIFLIAIHLETTKFKENVFVINKEKVENNFKLFIFFIEEFQTFKT